MRGTFLTRPANPQLRVYFFSLRSNVPIVASLTPVELTAIEQVSAVNGVHVKIETIEHGTIVYLDDTFPKARLLQFRDIYLHKTQRHDAAHLPTACMTWYDSITHKTIYFFAPVAQYIQNMIDVIKAFIGEKAGAKFMEDIYRRIVNV